MQFPMSINLFFRSFFRYLLIFLIFFLSAGALFGGYMLISDSSGASLHLPADTLTGSPFTNFTIPGIILLFSLGIFPLFLIYPLIFRPDWPRANLFNLYSERYWAWTYSLYVGIILVIWIDFQIFLIGGGSRIQFIYALLGIGIVITALLPSNIRFYSKMKDVE
jgi:hypothetical protein